MLKKHHDFFKSLLLLMDMALICVAWLGSYYVRFSLLRLRGEIHPPEPYLFLLLPIGVIWILTFRAYRLYRPRRISSRLSEVWDISKACTLATVTLFAISAFLRRFEYSRLVFVFFLILSIALVTLNRWTFREFLRFFRRRGYNLRYALVIGAGSLAQELVTKLHRRQEIGVRVIGYLTRKPEKIGKKFSGVKVLGTYSDLARIMTSKTVDQVFLALPQEEFQNMEKILLFLQEQTVDVRIVPDFHQYMSIQCQAELFDGLPIVTLQATPLYGWSLVSKRISDVIFSLLILVMASPVMIFVGLLVKLTSPGPILFRQKRMGYDGKVFEMLKFRSMYEDAEMGTGAVWAKEDDPRRTPIGSVLRRTSFDELPQFLNVLKGDMSIVGPRPERPELVEKFRTAIPKYMLRHKIKAGITGWAQVHGWRGNTSLEKRVQYDLEYIGRWSLALDLKIMFLTVLKGFINKNAY